MQTLACRKSGLSLVKSGVWREIINYSCKLYNTVKLPDIFEMFASFLWMAFMLLSNSEDLFIISRPTEHGDRSQIIFLSKLNSKSWLEATSL